MKIRSLKIDRFGGVKDKAFLFQDGFNCIARANEYGKSTSIEAIKAALYGFSPVKTFPYLPLVSSEGIRFTCEIDVSQEDSQLSKLLITRMHSGEKGSGTLELYSREGARTEGLPIRNKPVFDALREARGIDLGGMDSSLWILHSDSIEEHRRFLKHAKGEISLYESIQYRGRPLEDMLKSIEEERRAIYTNNANSNSKIKKNEGEIVLLNRLIAEQAELQRESASDYEDYLESLERRALCEETIRDLKLRIRDLEREAECYDLALRYRTLKEEQRVKGYQNAERTPHLGDWRVLKEKRAHLEQRMRELEQSMRAESEQDFDETVKSLVLQDHGCAAAGLLDLRVRLEDAQARLREKRVAPEQAGLAGSLGIDVERASEEWKRYRLESAKLRSLEGEERSMKSAELIFALLTLCIAFGLYFYNPKFTLLLIGVCSVYLFYQLSRKGRSGSRAQAIRDLDIAFYSEIGKMERAFQCISSLHELSEEAYELIRKDLDQIRNYQASFASYEELMQAWKVAAAEQAVTAELIRADGRSAKELLAVYRQDALRFRNSLERRESFRQSKDRISTQITELDEVINEIGETFLALWSTDDIEAVQERLEQAKHCALRLRELEDALARRGRRPEDFVPEGSDPAVDLELAEQSLAAEEEHLIALKERIAGLEERLARRELITHPSYRGLEAEELKALRETLREENRKLSEEYNLLTLKKEILIRSFELLKAGLKPSYVKRADEYLLAIAPDAGVRIEYSPSGEILFRDCESYEAMDFQLLSSGTQAQVLLCAKLAYLEEVDPEASFPLIVDDAFMSYDDRRKEKAIALLEQIAARRQILYFEAR